jgi:hypothetical protein
MLKEKLKRLIPALRHRPTVLRLHALKDAVSGWPTMLRYRMRKAPTRAFLPNRRKRICFISESPLRREPKFAFALKRAGWDVILVQGPKSRLRDFDDYAEVQNYGSSWEAVEMVRATGAPVAHHFSASFDPVSIRLVEEKPARVVLDFYDFFYGMADHRPGLLDLYSVDIAKQKYCYDRADGICTPDLQIQFDRRLTGVARGKPVLCFPNYCWNQLPLPPRRDNGEIHIVQVGFLNFEAAHGEDVGSYRVVCDLVHAGCHFHTYLHPHFPPVGTPQFETLFVDYLRLAQQTGRVHFHHTVPTRLLAQELTRYDFGFNMMTGPTYGLPLEHHSPRLMPLIGSARLFDYVDAGLPFLSDGMMSFNRHLFGRAFVDGTRLIEKGRIMEQLRDRLSYGEMLDIRARLAVQGNIDKLIRFYERLGA